MRDTPWYSSVLSPRPIIDEIVDYYLTETDTVDAVVVRVIFWDHVDLRLPDGRIVKDVRAALDWDVDGWTNVGRFKPKSATAPNARY